MSVRLSKAPSVRQTRRMHGRFADVDEALIAVASGADFLRRNVRVDIHLSRISPFLRLPRGSAFEEHDTHQITFQSFKPAAVPPTRSTDQV